MFICTNIKACYQFQHINHLTTVAARFDAITQAAIHQICLDKFLKCFNTQSTYSETLTLIEGWLLDKRILLACLLKLICDMDNFDNTYT